MRMGAVPTPLAPIAHPRVAMTLRFGAGGADRMGRGAEI